MGMPKRFEVFGVWFSRVSGQNKQNLSKADTSLKWIKFFLPWVSALGRFHCTFETRKRSFISAFSIYMTVPLSLIGNTSKILCRILFINKYVLAFLLHSIFWIILVEITFGRNSGIQKSYSSYSWEDELNCDADAYLDGFSIRADFQVIHAKTSIIFIRFWEWL